jgi:O-succinylbenzoic acid--CoA ligase
VWRVYSDRVTVSVVPAREAWPAVTDALAGSGVVAVADPSDAVATAVIRPDLPVEEPDAALIVLTSGSTGTPKGVVLARPALRAAAEALHDRLGGAGRWVCALPPGYVAGIMTLVRSWHAGREPGFAAPDLHDLDPGTGRTYVSVVATQMFRALDAPDVVARLRACAAVVVGGSAIPAGLLDRARAAGVRVVTSYGMSETCGGCVYDGRPLDGVRLDFDAAGRIAIGGPTVFSGYRLRPDLTQGVLRGGRFLTSDRGRWTPEGRLQVLGRIDDVIVSGGVNVDLAAVQRALDAAFDVEVVALGVPDPEWGTRVVVATTAALSLDDVTAVLAVGPAAMPRTLRRFAELPRTATGKLDRQELARRWEVADGNGHRVD